jgi:hypothetical protein
MLQLQVLENCVGMVNNLFDAFSDDLLKFFDDEAGG